MVKEAKLYKPRRPAAGSASGRHLRQIELHDTAAGGAAPDRQCRPDVFGLLVQAHQIYTAKGTAALLVPIGAVIAGSFGWTSRYYIAAAMNIGAAPLA